MKIYNRFFAFVFTILLCCMTSSQTDSVFILPKLKIDQGQEKKTVTYYFEEYSLNKFTVSDSFLTANTNIYEYRVKIADIKRISIYKGRDFWGGAAVVGSVGFGLGFLFWGFFDFDPDARFYVDHAFIGGVMTAVPFALVGGLIGLLSPTYDYYEMNKIPAKDRAAYVKKILKKSRVKFK